MSALNNLDNSAVTDEMVGHSFYRALRQTEKQKYTPTKGHEDAQTATAARPQAQGPPGKPIPSLEQNTPDEWLLDRVVGH